MDVETAQSIVLGPIEEADPDVEALDRSVLDGNAPVPGREKMVVNAGIRARSSGNDMAVEIQLTLGAPITMPLPGQPRRSFWSVGSAVITWPHASASADEAGATVTANTAAVMATMAATFLRVRIRRVVRCG
jgi:hypothetical protein